MSNAEQKPVTREELQTLLYSLRQTSALLRSLEPSKKGDKDH